MNAQLFSAEKPFRHTYSIVAHNPVSGELGVAVQSYWFSVGTVVSRAEAGIEAIATQSFSNPAFGCEGVISKQPALNFPELSRYHALAWCLLAGVFWQSASFIVNRTQVMSI
ncbi:MAG: DUF1028 domain-containing protein [Bacteroidetes bacterium]|nr:DUF1028 domain-containing protein [Bacteroidota bacterium]